jgi:hypothetical protein
MSGLYNVVVLDKHERIRSKHGPMLKGQAEVLRVRLKEGLRNGFRVEVRGDRREYWRKYHAARYENDPVYRARQLEAANRWNKRARAAAKGALGAWPK